MDRNVFVDWLENSFKPAVKKYQVENKTCGRALLLVNNCNSYILPSDKVNSDNDVDIVFLPERAMTVLQSKDQDITRKLKRCFRHRMLKRVLDFPRGVIQFYLDYDMKDCIDLLEEAWNDISSRDIYCSWWRFMEHHTVQEDMEPEVSQDVQTLAMSSIIVIAEIVGTIVR